ATPPLNLSDVRYVAAFDSSYRGDIQYAAVVVYDLKNASVVEKSFSLAKVSVPYIPGLLAFREVPGYVRAYSKLRVTPDVIMVDGHGLAHPRAFGIATHLGLALSKPSIGVAKNYLYGEIVEEGSRRLIKAHARVVGEVIEHRKSKLYVSIGCKIRLESAAELTRRTLAEGKRLPLPLSLADEYSKIIKREHTR
ncbi:MAG: endonuclease V, partial [Desulfurococcaceae archaeon]